MPLVEDRLIGLLTNIPAPYACVPEMMRNDTGHDYGCVCHDELQEKLIVWYEPKKGVSQKNT